MHSGTWPSADIIPFTTVAGGNTLRETAVEVSSTRRRQRIQTGQRILGKGFPRQASNNPAQPLNDTGNDGHKRRPQQRNLHGLQTQIRRLRPLGGAAHGGHRGHFFRCHGSHITHTLPAVTVAD